MDTVSPVNSASTDPLPIQNSSKDEGKPLFDEYGIPVPLSKRTTRPYFPGIKAVPKRDDPKTEAATIAFFMDKFQIGQAFLKSQPNFNKIQLAVDAVMGMDSASITANLSTSRTNRIGKVNDDITATLTDTKPFWDYHTYNNRFEQHAQNYSRGATLWYQRRSCDLAMFDVINYHNAAGTGYLHMYWDPELQDIRPVGLNPLKVIPIDPIGNKSLEDCKGAIIYEDKPISYFQDTYGIFIQPDSTGGVGGFMNRASNIIFGSASPIHLSFASDQKASAQAVKTAREYIAYIKDYRCNCKEDLGDSYTGQPIPMGDFMEVEFADRETGEKKKRYEPANHWSYWVHPGDPLYPHGRQVIFTARKLIRDGPSPYWHGHIPIIKFTLNPIPHSWFGKAPLADLLDLQQSLNKMLRVIDDHADQVAQPGLAASTDGVSPTMFDDINTRRAGWKVHYDSRYGEPFKIVPPPVLEAMVPEHRDWLCNEIDMLSGVADLRHLMQLNQMPSSTTMESIVNSMSPILRLKSRIMEAFIREVAYQYMFNFSQFYSIEQITAMLGLAGITLDNFDFDPGTSVPDFLFSDMDPQGKIKPEAIANGPRPRYQRAREFLRMFTFKIQPGSWLQSAELESTMFYFQLVRAGIMDPISLLEKLNVPNIGTEILPPTARTILQRIAWCQQNGLMMDVNAAGRKASGGESPRIKVSESG